MFLHQMEVFVIIIIHIFLQCIRQNIYKQLIVYCISEFFIRLYEQNNISLLLQQQEKSLPTWNKEQRKDFYGIWHELL